MFQPLEKQVIFKIGCNREAQKTSWAVGSKNCSLVDRFSDLTPDSIDHFVANNVIIAGADWSYRDSIYIHFIVVFAFETSKAVDPTHFGY
mgnify:CR=1 FL=1